MNTNTNLSPKSSLPVGGIARNAPLASASVPSAVQPGRMPSWRKKPAESLRGADDGAMTAAEVISDEPAIDHEGAAGEIEWVAQARTSPASSEAAGGSAGGTAGAAGAGSASVAGPLGAGGISWLPLLGVVGVSGVSIALSSQSSGGARESGPAPVVQPTPVSPALTIGPTSAGTTVNLDESTAAAGIFVVKATAGAAVTVALTGTAGVVTRTSTASGGSEVITLNAAEITALGDGTVQVTATASVAGATSTTRQASFRLDTAAPSAPLLALASDTGASTADGATHNGQVNVSGLEAGATWQYSTDSGMTWATGAGSSFALSDGTHAAGSVLVRQTDLAGNVSVTGTNTSIMVDATAPPAPSLALATDTGASATDGITNSGVLTIAGLEMGATWQYSTNSGSTWAAGSGSSVALADGAYATGSVLVRQSDLAGNVSVTGVITSIIVDTTAPAAPWPVLATDTGASAVDGITNTGQVNVPGLEAGATWQYSTDSGSTWATGTGSSFAVVDGTHAPGSVLVRQTDLAGNTGASGATTASITVDTAAPVAPLLALASDTGASTTDGITNSGQVNVSGLEAGATWQYSTDSGSTWATGSGASFALTAGAHATASVLVRQIDLAGNTGASSANTASITVDTAAPAAPLLALASDTGASNTDGITNSGQVNVSGLEAGATWQYSTDSGSTWATGTGNSFALSDGTHAAGSVLVRQADIAGNVSVTGANILTIVDAAAPAAPSLALASDTGASATDGITHNGQVNVSGLEAGATWQYSTDSGSTWATGTGSSFALSEGSYAAGAVLTRQTDLAGNVSTAPTGMGPIVVDQTGPAAAQVLGFYDFYNSGYSAATAVYTDVLGASLVQPASSGGPTSIDGHATAGAVVSLTLGTGNVRQVTASTQGYWEYYLLPSDLSAMGVGAETISASTTDVAGNLTTTTHDVVINAQAVTTSSIAADGYGSAYVDALVYGHAGWTGGIITYSFSTLAGDPNSAWSDAEKAAARAALQVYSNVANLQFMEGAYYSDDVNQTNLVLDKLPDSTWNGDGTLAEFALPRADPGSSGYDINGPVVGHFNYDVPSWADLTPGGLGFYTLVHEFGHGLGLTHTFENGTGQTTFPGVAPGDASALGDHDLSQGIWSVMAYNFDWDSQPAPSGASSGLSTGPMVFDIAAVQALYGANTTYQTGDNIYLLPSADGLGVGWTCIWDAGGDDTLSNAAGSLDCVLNLNAYPLVGGLDGALYVSHATGVAGGYTIAAGAAIENATGGSGDDVLIGNGVGNSLTGGLGADLFYFVSTLGSGNVDTLTDFSVAQGDSVWLDASVFTALGGASTMTDHFRLSASTASGGDDYIVYDLPSGNLYYDASGAGSGASGVLFASFSNVPVDLTATNFAVI